MRLGQRVRAAQGLRAEDDVDAERTALPDQAVEQQRDFLGDLVVLDEELLELVDDEQDARQRHFRAGPRDSRSGPDTPSCAEEVAAVLELDVQPLEHAQAELALALDGDDPRVRQLERGVDLELDALLEVDQVQLELVGAVAQRGVGDQGVQQRRLARARLAGDQHVLRRALAELEVLQLGGAGAAERECRRPCGCRSVQYWSGLGAMNSNGTSTRLASRAASPTLCRISENRACVGGRVEREREPAEVRLAPLEPAVLPDQVARTGSRGP